MVPAKQAPQRQRLFETTCAEEEMPRSSCIHSGNRTREFHRSRGRRYSCFNWREPLNRTCPALKPGHAQPDVARGQGGTGLYDNTPLTGAQAPEPPPSLHCSFQPRTSKKVSRPYSEGPRAGNDMSSRARKDSPIGIILQVYSAQTPTTSIKPSPCIFRSNAMRSRSQSSFSTSYSSSKISRRSETLLGCCSRFHTLAPTAFMP